jgi:hypothetical protein
MLLGVVNIGLSGCAGLVSAGGSSKNPTPFTISNAKAASVTQSGFQVDWSTSAPATSKVNYGLTASYGSTTGVNSSMVSTHQVAVASLVPGKTYHFQIYSTDASGNTASSGDMTVSTLADMTPPTVSITSPAAGSTISGSAIIISATASDNVGIAGVQFKVDSVSTGSPVIAAPYTYTWNTTMVANGNHTLTAVATDTAGNSATSAAVSVAVNNTTKDTTPPTVSITAPANGATVSNTVTVSANATDNVAVASVQFKLDGANLGSLDTTAPYSVSWNTTTVANGNHTLTAVATDTSGNSATSAGVSVAVNNTTKDTTPPTVSITAPANGATVSNTVTVSANATDNVAVASVQFQLDGANMGSLDTTAPYSVSWNTTTASNGSHTLRAIATDTSNNSATSAGVIVTVNNAAGAAPTISGVASSSVISTSAVINWSTDISSDSQVDYGTSTSYGQTTQLNSSLVTSHSVSLAGLSASTLYHFRVKSKSSGGSLATSADFTLTTVPTPPIQTGTSLSSLAASMPPGTWALLTTNGFNSGNAVRPPDGGSSLEYMDRGSWNPINKTVMILGAAHVGVETQSTDVFSKYTDSNNTWSVFPNTLGASASTAFDTAFCNGSWCDIGHGYDQGTIDTSTGDFYHRQYGAGKVMKWGQSTQAWQQCSVIPSGSYQVAGALTYFPDRHSLVWLDGDFGAWELSISGGSCSGSWTHIGGANQDSFSPRLAGLGSYHNEGEYSFLCQCVILGGGNGSNVLYKYSSAGTFTQIATPPVAKVKIPDDSVPDGTVFTVDPASGHFMLWDQPTAGSQYYDYNPNTNVWITVQTSGGAFPSPQGNDFDVVAIPISDYGVTMFVEAGANSGGQVWLFKTAAGAAAQGGGANPTAISSVSTTGVTTTSALVSWTTTVAADSQVFYGTTNSYGQSTTLNSSLVTSHSVTLPGLTAGNEYHFQVKSHDGSGTLVTSGDFSFSTLLGVTNTPPTVSISAPVSGATISGTVSISATASASAGIASVQFLVDSANQGALDTTSPYSLSWDTTTVADGSYTLAAIATDNVGNSVTSAAVTVTVANNSGPGNTADFQARCAAAGVIRCVGFDTGSDINGTWGNNVGILAGDVVNPTLDSTVKASGNSSLKFTIPALAGANSSGSYFANFSSDLSKQFGENSNLYIQWRQRFSPEFISNADSAGGGWKQSIIGTGDIPGCTTSSGSAFCSTSCTDLEVVTLNALQRGFAQMYDSCTGSTSHGAYDPFEQPFGSDDFKLQNAMPAPYCLYSQAHTSPPTTLPPAGNCFGYFPNEWMTFQVHIQTGPRVNDEFTNSFVELWIAREGQPSTLVINWGPYNLSAGAAATNQKFGKVWLIPYNTGKDATVSYPVAYTWYDELIISTQQIPDPK